MTQAREATVPQPNAPLVGPLWSAWLYLRSISVDLAHRIIKRRRRVRTQVLSDYDAGEWAQQAHARDWLRAETLVDYVDRAWSRRELVCLIDDKLRRMPARDYYRLKRGRIGDVMRRFAGDTDTLVELGSGTGTNLFGLALDGQWSSLIGLELSKTGQEVGEAVARHFRLTDRIGFGEIDLVNPRSPGYATLKGRTVFTHYCLEQLPDDTEAVFRHLCAAGIRRAIHLEPSFELLSSVSLRDLASMSYVWRQDYQRTMVRCARRLEAEGKIRIVAVERLSFASSLRNPPTLLVWEPI